MTTVQNIRLLLFDIMGFELIHISRVFILVKTVKEGKAYFL